ncbi:hypothetical protein [Ideonella sp.]|uniref:hypothetical protein n=1 Tax=Ideonella sp. TaxID=1929293 RepID=UPI0035B3F332
MSWIEEAKKAAVDATDSLARSGPKLLLLVVHPSKFYRRSRRVKEVAAVLALNAVLLAAIHFFVLKSVVEVKDPSQYAIGAVFFNVLHLAIMGFAFAAPSAIGVRSTPFPTHLANALFAMAVLPIVAMLTVSATRLRAAATLAGNPSPVIWQDLLVLLGYCWVTYRVYCGLRVGANSSRPRAAVAALAGFALVLTVMATNLAPNQAMLLSAWTR